MMPLHTWNAYNHYRRSASRVV